MKDDGNARVPNSPRLLTSEGDQRGNQKGPAAGLSGRKLVNQAFSRSGGGDAKEMDRLPQPIQGFYLKRAKFHARGV